MTKGKKMTIWIRIIIGVLAVLVSYVCFAQDNGKAAYIEAYSDNVKSSLPAIAKGFEVNGAPPEQALQEAEAFVEKAINCHATHFDEYPEALKTALFEAIASGGSYPDAERTIENFVLDAQIAGDEASFSQFMTATENGLSCLRG